ncbi:MAG: beta-Ala-His dipeptidase [Clostridia bacterium]|nr:beta-Ala-His dipeptidase [Clostridia bacterium]
MNDKEIIEAVAGHFLHLAQIPRPSHHEEKVSRYLADWAAAQGFTAVRDAVKNVRIDVPATPGMEQKPLGILQAHMDMVVAVADGVPFDPCNDPITVIRDDEAGTLTAAGTSLGADDGAGLALMMAAVQGGMAHGPLRIIATVDEEDGMEGAFHLNADWLRGAAYLINLDSECADEALVSTAAGHSVYIRKALSLAAAAGSRAVRIGISGLKGGHSGMEIHKGRLNGIVALAGFLKQLDGKGIRYELASLEGGSAMNAIPGKATAVLVIDPADRCAIEGELARCRAALVERYAGVEENIVCTLTGEEGVPQVVSEQEKACAVRFVTGIIDGVYSWSEDMEGLVVSSSNLGLFRLDGDGLFAGTLIRSSDAQKETEILRAQLALAEACGYAADAVKTADAWPYDPDSVLLALCKKIYREQNGSALRVTAAHAGLECGTFKALQPGLDMISIGPDLKDIHTVKETLCLRSLPKIWRLLEGLLAEYPAARP